MKTALSKITSLALAFALAISMVALPSTALTASAAEIGKPSEIAVDHTGVKPGSTIMFGENKLMATGSTSGTLNPHGDGSPINWRVVANDGTTLTLLADNKLGNRRYDPSQHRLWSGSEICNYLNGTGTYTNAGFLQSSFSAGERSAMVAQYSTVQEQGFNAGDIYTANQTIVLPSVAEIEDNGTWGFASYPERTLVPSDFWWLRSAGFDNDSAAFVWGDGDVDPYGNIVNFDLGIRPALKINLTSVIFSSSAAGGKPTQVGANLEVAQPPTGEIKLTVLDSSQALNVIATTPQQTQSGSTLNFSYDSATTGTNQWVSCVLEASTGAVAYYGKLADSSSAASGTLSIPLTGVVAGTYKLRIFSEQDNGVNQTDFASTPIDMTVVVSGGNGTVSGYTGSLAVAPTISGGVTATTDNITVYEGYAAQTKTYTIAGLPAPAMTVTSDGGTGATVTPAGVLSIPTGLAKGDYTIVITAANGQSPDATMTVSLTVNYAQASISVQPANATIIEGGDAIFSVAATGSATLTYLWEESDNGTSWGQIAGANTATLTLTSVPIANDGKQYRCVVDNPANTPAISNAATLTVNVTPTAPTVTPTNLSVQEGSTSNFAVYMGTGTNKADSVTIASDNLAVAKVDTADLTANGNVVVTGVAEGKTTVTLGWSGGSLDGTSTTVAVDVTKTPPPTPPPTPDPDPTPDPTPTPSYSRGSSSSGSSSKADIAPVFGRIFTRPVATKLFAAALAAKPVGQTTLSIKAYNYTSGEKSAFAELAALAQKNGVTLTVHFDTVVDKAVTYRMSVNPAGIATNLDLTAKIVGSKITLPKFSPAVEIAVKMPAGITVENLKITQNGKDITNTAKPWLDKNGYLHFTTTGGEIVLGK